MADRSGCARPGCSGTGAALLTYDYATRTVWLDPLGEVLPGAWSVCAAHADGLKVPMGWGLHDRRRTLMPLQGTLAS